MTNDKSQPLRWTKKDEEKNAAHKAGEEKRDSKGTVRYKRVPLLGEDGKPVVRRTATASKLFTKADMAELHPAMERHLCAALGVEHVGMVLDETDRDRKWSELDHDDYVTVTTQRDKALAEIERANRSLRRRSPSWPRARGRSRGLRRGLTGSSWSWRRLPTHCR